MFDELPCELNEYILTANIVKKKYLIKTTYKNKHSIENIKYVHSLCNFTRDEFDMYNNMLLYNVCRYGNIKIAKWLHVLCNFTRD